MRVEHLHPTDTDGTSIVVKRLTARELREPEAWARLVAEADLLESLGGRLTPRVLRRGEDEKGPWVELARVPHPTLAELIADATAPPADAWIARVLAAALDALVLVHEHRDASGPLLVIHGDISPPNLVVSTPGDLVVLLDFDLALHRGSPARDGAFRGTLRYAPPEVARGERPDARSDLFGLGASLLHAITLTPPRRGTSFPALLAEAAEAPLLDEGALRAMSGRGRAFETIAACLAFDPAARPQTARAARSGL